MTGVIDYGVGNLFSLASSLRAIGEETVVTASPETLAGCDRLVLPGVGAFGAAMDVLAAKKLDRFIVEQAKKGKPLLGICLGMQLLFSGSYEFGAHKGLGLIEGEIVPLEDELRRLGKDYKVPQIGWNELVLRRGHEITKYLRPGDYAYYVHSYYAPVGEYTVAYSDYGALVTGIAAAGNVVGCQFHPEKSGRVGLKMLAAFTGREAR